LRQNSSRNIALVFVRLPVVTFASNFITSRKLCLARVVQETTLGSDPSPFQKDPSSKLADMHQLTSLTKVGWVGYNNLTFIDNIEHRDQEIDINGIFWHSYKT
jgi:hypothetical protein